MTSSSDRNPAAGDPGGATREPQGDGGEGSSRETSRREYALWGPEEERTFYNVLKSCVGERTLVIVSKCCEAIPTKDYNQVRDYYYRLQKRLNRLLAKELQFDGKSPAPLHQAMLKFWEVLSSNGLHGTNLRAMKNQPRKRKMLSMAVVKSIRGTLARARALENGRKRDEGDVAAAPKGSQTSRRAKGKSAQATKLTASRLPENDGGNSAAVAGSVQAASAAAEVSSAGPALLPVPAAQEEPLRMPMPPAPQASRLSAALPSCVAEAPASTRAPPSISQGPEASCEAASSGSGGKGPKVELRLAPCTVEVQSRMEKHGHTPFVELVCCPSKSVLSVLGKMEKKWASALNAEGQTLSLLLCDSTTLVPIDLGTGDVALKVGELRSRVPCSGPLELRYTLVVAPTATPHDVSEAAVKEACPVSDVPPALQTTPMPTAAVPGGAIGTPPSAELRPALERSPALFSAGFLAEAPTSTGQHPWWRLQSAPDGLRTGDTPPGASCPKDTPTADALEGVLFGLGERKTQLTTPGPILGLGESSLRSWPDLSPPSLHGEFSSLSKLGGASNFSRFFSSFSSGGCSNAAGELALPSERSLSAHPGDALDLRPERNILSSLLGTPGSDTYDCADRCEGDTPCHRPFATLFDN